MIRFPVYQPNISDKEKELVNECLDSSWISSKGKYIKQFEQLICNYTSAKYAVAVSNGTVALHLALLAHGIGENDEVIVPELTYIAPANAVLYVQAKPVFCDVNYKNWNLSLENISEKVNSKTKAIIIANIYGCPAKIDLIRDFARKYNLLIIEDSAESLGASYKNEMSGNLGDISTLSFFGNKTITTGEGGMVLTNNHSIYLKLLQLRNQGNSDTIRYYHDFVGYNYRMTNIQAAIGVAQMSRIDSILERKRKIQFWYEENLKDFVVFQEIDKDLISSYWMVSFILPLSVSRESLMLSLKEDGIETRPFFKPISSMPYFKSINSTNAKKLSKSGISMPSYPELTFDDVSYICKKLIEYLKK